MIDEAFLGELSAHAYGWPESLQFTYTTARRLLANGVEGCMVECGVAAGVHPAAMARACTDHDEPRLVHLFDSFEGIPHGGPHDTDWNQAWGDGTGRLVQTGVTVHALADVEANLDRWCPGYHSFAFYKGWFQETVETAAPHLGPIAFLRLDGDLYESTRVCLEHLYPLVVSGGVVVVDDWNLDGCQIATVEYLRRVYGVEFSKVYRMEEDGPHEDGAAGGSIRIAPITASGDVWWTKP